MAQFEIAFNWIMQNEDGPGPPYRYRTVADTGGQAISGINSAAYPGQFAAIDALSVADRGAAVEAFYRDNFWNQWYGQLANDELAKRVLDAAVNMGPGTAVKLLQSAVNASVPVSAPRISMDGHWGPATVSSANGVPSADWLVSQFKQCRLAHYQDIVFKNPDDQRYLGTEAVPGPWRIRCMK